MKNVLTLFVCAGSFLATGGCESATGPDRIAVVGSVTTESGDPVDGMISFLPESGTPGPAATASLTGGDFTFDRKTGPVAGKYRVLVVRRDPHRKHKGASGPKPARPSQGTAPQIGQSTADGEWTFTAEVSADDFEFDFQVPD